MRIEPSGGKLQLSGDEAKLFLATALPLAATQPGTLAAATALLLGVRASEVADRVVGEVDLGGTVLRIARGKGKTKNASRGMPLAEVLQPLFRAYAQGEGRDEPLLDISHYVVGFWTKKICRLGKLPEVCATPCGDERDPAGGPGGRAGADRERNRVGSIEVGEGHDIHPDAVAGGVSIGLLGR